MSDQRLLFLIIDDDPGDIELLRRNLETVPDLQAEIVSLSTSIKAQAILACRKVDLVFIDYRLVSNTGLDIFRVLREAGCNQPMIMLTGMGNEMVAVEAMKAGFADYLVKNSIDPANLYRAITNALEKAALMQQLEAQQKKLEELARFDVLTGLYNQSYFFERLSTEIHRSLRYGHEFALLMFDIDFFKSINDTHGHLFGDLVLTRIGGMIRAHIRNTDIAGRFGGEEFIFGLCNTGRSGAETFAERIRKAIAAEPFITPEQDAVHITCSIGISLVDSTTPDAPAAIYRADKALYEAKAAGRNRVCTWESDPNNV